MSEATPISRRDSCRPLRQRGMALIVAMVFLTLLTILGLSAMQNTTLQERMAGNQRDHHMAFQAAEAALREAERQIEEGSAGGAEPGGSPGPAFEGEYAMPSEAGLAQDPSYRIVPGTPDSLVESGCERIYRPFLISATGYGGSPNSRVELEVRYVTDNGCE